MIDHSAIAKKWQRKWEESKVFKVDMDSKKEKFYCLEMYPYPSGSGLHMGHALNYTLGDIFARYKVMKGFNVLHPMGFDSFGLPAENAAIKAKSHPKKFTEKAISSFIEQMKTLGISYDWDRMVQTHKPDYYKWDQWIFLKMYEKGLAYKKTSGVNWCPKCNTVLANEQVHNGKCWRHEDTEVEVKNLEQWYLKITDYADELYEGIDKLTGWPELIKKLQRNWINKSYGAEVNFEINGEDWPVFTTRVDTLMGVTFVVVAAGHTKLDSLVTKDQKEIVTEFKKEIHSVKAEDIDQMEKQGVFTGSYAIHPLTKEKIPVYAGNFVLADYGSGMVMAVPGHDQRDFDFAKKYNISIKQVITNKEKNVSIKKEAFTEPGFLVNSGEFDNLSTEDAKEKITKKLVSIKKGKQKVNFRLRDWLISRQRFWGTPIPIIYCDKCGAVPVKEKDLPVELPDDVVFESTENPLKKHEKFINVPCPKCGGKGRRETDTMDTFVNSSWYQLRYCDPKNSEQIFNKQKVDYWCPVDQYIGGKEHACMHLIYIRFYTKFFRDLGLLNFDEPAIKLFNQGMLMGPDGEKMSKSKGNVIVPSKVINKYSLDAVRLFLVSVASPDKDLNWSDNGVESALRFINRIYAFVEENKFSKSSKKVENKVNSTIKYVSESFDEMKYNLIVIKLRELFDSFSAGVSKEDFTSFVSMLAPFCPHTAEEIWAKLGNKDFICKATWPEFDESKIDAKLDYLDEVTDNLRKDIQDVLQLIKVDKPEEIKLIVSSSWKYDFVKLFKEAIKESRNPKDIIAKIMATDLKKHGGDVMKMIPLFLKDESKLPKAVINIDDEKENLNNIKESIEKEFNSKIVIELADESKEQKAKNASPGKPAILIKS